MPIVYIHLYTRSPLQDSRLFGPSPWKVLAATYETNGFLSNPDPGENLVSGNLLMETGCTASAMNDNSSMSIISSSIITTTTYYY